MTPRPSHFCFLAIALLAAGGCDGGPQLSAVRGRITLDGQPLSAATIVFRPQAGGRASMATTDAAGNYELTYLRDMAGAVVGPHQVTITTASEANPTEMLPARYHSESELVEEVASGANEINFDLKGAP